MIIDACVWVSAFLSHEKHYEECSRLLYHAYRQGLKIAAPSIMIAEVAAAVARQTRDGAQAAATVKAIEEIPFLTLHAVDGNLARAAADIAGHYFLRGADAVYVALAQHTASPLITLDAGIMERAAETAEIIAPSQWLQREEA